MSAATRRPMDFGVVLQNDPPAQRVLMAWDGEAS